jgi:hypothetical protein
MENQTSISWQIDKQNVAWSTIQIIEVNGKDGSG